MKKIIKLHLLRTSTYLCCVLRWGPIFINELYVLLNSWYDITETLTSVDYKVFNLNSGFCGTWCQRLETTWDTQFLFTLKCFLRIFIVCRLPTAIGLLSQPSLAHQSKSILNTYQHEMSGLEIMFFNINA